MSNNYDVIVLGAGPGGVTAASLLAHHGKRVLLVDKNSKPGGRMITIQRDEFSYELFPINCVPAHNSLFERLSTELGKSDKVEVIYGDESGLLGKIAYEDKNGKLSVFDIAGGVQGIIQGLGGGNAQQLAEVGKMCQKLAAMPESEIDTLYDISARDYLAQYEIPDGFRTFFLASFGEGGFEMSADKVPAAHLIMMYQLSMKQGGGRFYNGGIGHFFEVMAETVEENNGGKWLMKTRVASIDVENGTVKGITTAKGEKYTAPVVISSAGIRQTIIKLVGEQYFEQAYVDSIRKLESNLACVGYRYFINKPLLDYPTLVYFPEGCIEPYADFEKMARGERKPEHNYIYVGTTSVYPGLAPKGKQLIYAVMSCAPDPELDTKPYLEYVEKKARMLVPELYDGRIERTEIMSPADVVAVGNDSIFPGQGGESYGIANSVGQSGKNQPKGDTPIKGLYIVGNDSAGFGVGTHQAVDSGYKIFDMVQSNW